MSDPQRQAEGVSPEKATDEPAPARRAPRPQSEDPLAELARILGEGVAHPVRPEHVVEIGRRVLPTKPAPQQVSDLEAELFESLRSSVAPEDRVRGDFVREVPPIIPQQPVDDHDIASLRAIAGEAADEAPTRAPVAETQPDPRLADYYAYDDGISAGSYDPAFAGTASSGAHEHAARGRAPGDPRPTFEDFDTAAIAEAARETSPYTAADSVILPHSQLEEYEARQLPREGGRGGFRAAAAVVALLLVGGGALAGWKVFGGSTSRGPVTIHADGQPLKVLPDPGKAQPSADGEISMKRDTKVDGSKIVSLQEDPVEHVAGRAADGREVRVINPGAQRPASSDQPRTVKTVVVRPDGSIVTDGDAPAAAPTPPVGTKTVTTTTIAAVPPVPTVPQAGAPASAIPPVSAVPPVGAVPPAAAPSEAAPVAPAVAVPMPVAAPPRPVAAPKPAAPIKAATVTPAEAPVEPAPAAAAPRPVKPIPLAPPKAPAVKAPAAGGNAPMALGPVGARPAAPAEAAPRPAPAAPAVAAGGSGDWVVQLSSSKSEAEARGSLSAAQRRYSVLAGKAGDVQRADLGAKGTYYRARVSAGSREAAAALCSQVKAQGGDCVVTRR